MNLATVISAKQLINSQQHRYHIGFLLSSRALHGLHVFLRFASFACFLRFAPFAYFPGLCTVCIFSRALHCLHVFPHLAPFACFSVICAACMFSRTLTRLHVFPRFACFPVLCTVGIFSQLCNVYRSQHQLYVFSLTFDWFNKLFTFIDFAAP